MFPNYEGLSDLEKIASCIAFELSHGGNEVAAASAILRDIERGYILPHLTKYAPDAASATSAEQLSSLESVPAVEADPQPRG